MCTVWFSLSRSDLCFSRFTFSVYTLHRSFISVFFVRLLLLVFFSFFATVSSCCSYISSLWLLLVNISCMLTHLVVLLLLLLFFIVVSAACNSIANWSEFLNGDTIFVLPFCFFFLVQFKNCLLFFSRSNSFKRNEMLLDGCYGVVVFRSFSLPPPPLPAHAHKMCMIFYNKKIEISELINSRPRNLFHTRSHRVLWCACTNVI